MKVGYSCQDITPGIGDKMAAFPQKPGVPRRVVAIHDPLYVKSLFVTDGKESFCICVCDLCFWQTGDVNRLRTEIAEKVANLAEDHIMICCTHTHSGGENTFLFGAQSDDKWLVETKKKLVDTVVQSSLDPMDAQLFAGQRDAPYNHNRRVCQDSRMTMIFDRSDKTSGVTDPTMSLIRFKCQDGRQFDWINWTGHALTVGPDNDQITADYPGALCKLIASGNPEKNVLFTNGCAGNIHPCKSMKKGFDACDYIARKLFECYLELEKQLEQINGPELALVSKSLELRHRHHPDLPIFINMSCLTLGEYRIGFLPGEPYVEFQLAYREAMLPGKSFVNGYSNGWQGYLPTEQAFAEGGYGVDSAPDSPPEFGRAQITTGDGEAILQELINISSIGD